MLKKLLFTLGIALCFSSASQAKDYPNRTVTIVVPFPAGQTGDIVARAVSEELSIKLGTSFIVENKPGAGGQLGTAYAARAKKDGYTILMTSSGPFSIAPALYNSVSYNPLEDFVGIASVATTPQILAVSPESKINTVAELIEKAKNEEFTYASAGNGSTQHLSMELLKLKTNTEIQHIPYKGSAESKTAVISNLIPATVDSIPAVLPDIKNNKLKALAILDSKRSEYLPDVETLKETGFPEIEAVAFFGLVAPSGTPDSVLDTLNNAIKDILEKDNIKKKFASLALTTEGQLSSQEYQAYLKSETNKWQNVIKESGVNVQ